MRHELWRPTARRVTLCQLILINTLHTLHSSQRPPRRRCAPSTSVRPRLQRTAVPVARAPRRARRRDGVSCCTTGTSAQSRPSRGTSRCTPHVPQPMSCPRLGKATSGTRRTARSPRFYRTLQMHDARRGARMRTSRGARWYLLGHSRPVYAVACSAYVVYWC